MRRSRHAAGRCREHGAGAAAFELGREQFLTSASLKTEKSEPVVSEGTNKRYLHKALKRLKEAFENDLLKDRSGNQQPGETGRISCIQEAVGAVRTARLDGGQGGEC
ncbi:hypothetical protein [Candidatus Methylacidiphilum fumarolicum]|uniref:hypothetical protein n=1 Tax=Candidatus Methylacidiphilum fumarolicum TaxID=591154 RepID=UPI0003145E26|nr:hypothetical protein [Candidatus Methylacidiphilum fumarolicum]